MLFENMGVGLTVAFIALLFASVVDIKKREVPDWISYSLMIFSIGYALMLSVYHDEWGFLANSIVGMIIGLIIGFAMFYTGQWGGGDSKLIIGICSIFGFSIPGVSKIYGNYELPIFLVNTILVGAVYGLLFSIYHAMKNFRNCRDEAKEKLKEKKLKYAKISILILVIMAVTYHFFSATTESMVFLVAAVTIAALFYLSVLLSCVEAVCMIKDIDASKLTEGDWLARPIVKNGKTIVDVSKTGLSMDDLAKIRKSSIAKVTVKEGIPFVPSFLIAYILTILLQNWLSLLI